MSQVEIIKANTMLSERGNRAHIERLRVAPYCRVSTDSEEQLNSYKSQVQHYTDFINNRKDWVLVDIYADEHAIIGTSGENLVKSRVSALVPFNFFVKGKYNFI